MGRRKRADSIEKPSGTYHHGNLREALVNATLELIADEGVEGLSLRAIARRAGVSAAAPYRHFESREAVLAEVAEQGFRMLAEAIRASSMEQQSDDPIEQLCASGVAYVRFATEHRAHYAVMFSPELNDREPYPDLEEAAQDSFGLLLEAIRRCQEAGAVIDEDPRRLALVAWSTVHGLSALIGAGHLNAKRAGFSSTDALSEFVAETLIAGVAR